MSFHIFLTLFLALFVPLLLLIVMIKKKKHEQIKRLPPGPKKLPIIGNLHQLISHKSFLKILQHLRNEHGSLMFLQLGSVPTLIVSSAAMAKEIYKTHDLIFASRPVLYTAKMLTYNNSTISFAPYGEYWKQIRKIAVTELLSSKRIQSFQAIREEEVNFMIKYVANSSLVNFSELMHLLINNVILKVVFGKTGSYGSEQNGKSDFDEILDETHDLLGRVNIADSFPWIGWWLNKLNGFEARLKKNSMELDSFYNKVIQQHRECQRLEHEEDFVDVLLRVQNDPNQEMRLTNDHIKGVLTDMFIAGTDSTSTTLEWTMTELIKNPSVMRKAQAEVRGVVKEKVKESDLSKLEYLKMVVKEALRRHSPIPLIVPHESTERCTINGYEIPAKTRVFINTTSISMDPEYWENPEDFKPERFLNSNVDVRGQHFELLPFGAGRRGCPGTNFAAVIIELALANLLYSFDWKLPDGMSAQDVDMEEDLGFTLKRKTPLRLVASPTCV